MPMVPAATRVISPVIRLERGAQATLTAQIVEQLRGAILDGVLPSGHKLPSSRELARDLGVSRNTTAAAYEALAAEGTLVIRARRAPIAGDVPARLAPAAQPTRAMAPRLSRSTQRAAAVVPPDRIDELLSQRARSRPFGVGLPDLELFPWRVFERCLVNRFRAMTTLDTLHDDPRGLSTLRRAILNHIALARGVRATVDQVFITEGSQGAIDLACRALLDAGDEAWIEDPGPLALRAAVRMAGARPIPIPVDEGGMRVRVGARRSPSARVVFVSPAYAFPTGARLDPARRLELLAWARGAGAMVVEIDYEGELRFQGAPLPSLLAQGGEGTKDHVLHIGTFSRALFPGLRLGFLVVPPALVRPVALIRAATTRSPPHLTQAALADFIDQGHLARHLRALRQATRRRRDLLVAELERLLPDSFCVQIPAAGPVLTVRLPPGMDDVGVVHRLARRGVDAVPLSRNAAGRHKPSGLILGFGAHSEAALLQAARTLAETVTERRVSSR
jgi:GntR family transcriptional regulator/MocR family aminotransferase